jgi:hypothetical protein
MYFPDEFSDDFLEYVYLKKKNRISQETKCFIKQIMHLLGIKTEFKIDRSQWILSRLFSFMQRKTERRKYDR